MAYQKILGKDIVLTILSSEVDSATFSGSGTDDMTTGGSFTGDSAAEYVVEIDGTGTPDTFKWSDDGGSTWDATTVDITGSAQSLNNGVEVTFGSTTGHDVGDRWTFDAGKTPIEGISTVTLGKDYTDSDTSDNDSAGNAESLPTKIGRSVDIEGNRLEDTNGDLATGQLLLQDQSEFVGYDNETEYILSSQSGDGVEKVFDAWVEFGEPIGGGHEDHVGWSATLHVNGSITTNP